MLMWLCETYQTERYCICRLFCSARDHSSHSWTIQHDSAFGISQCLVSIPTPREMAQELRAHDLCYYIGQSQCPPLTEVQWFTLLFSQMTLRPPYPHFQIRLRLFLFWQWKMNDWNPYHIFLKQSTWTVMTSRQRPVILGTTSQAVWPRNQIQVSCWSNYVTTSKWQHVNTCSCVLYNIWLDQTTVQAYTDTHFLCLLILLVIYNYYVFEKVCINAALIWSKYSKKSNI